MAHNVPAKVQERLGDLVESAFQRLVRAGEICDAMRYSHAPTEHCLAHHERASTGAKQKFVIQHFGGSTV